MPVLLLAAKILSGFAFLALAVALLDLWRRGEVPTFAYGTVELSQRRMKAVWVAFLLGAMAVGMNNDPLFSVTNGTEGSPEASREVTSRNAVSLALPFYRYEREREVANGVVASERVFEGVLVPWAFLWALFAYYVLVVRWNPESRWARRVLEGKRR